MSTAYSMGFMRRRDMALKYFETESINHFFNCNLHFFCFPNPFPFNAKKVDDYRILWDMEMLSIWGYGVQQIGSQDGRSDKCEAVLLLLKDSNGGNAVQCKMR